MKENTTAKQEVPS